MIRRRHILSPKGRWKVLSANRFLAGTIDDFAIWNRALSPAEAALLSMQPPRG